MIYKFVRKFFYNRFNLSVSKLPPKYHASIVDGEVQLGLEDLADKNYKFYFVCFGEKSDSLYWLRDWLNVFSGFNVNFLIVLRSKELQDWIFENYPSVDSVTVSGFQAIVDLYKITASTTLALYPINSMYNHMFVRLTSVRHVFIGHGDSDKLSSANKVLRMFDEIWCAGQAQVDRMLNQGFDCRSLRLRKVGRPGLLRLIADSKSEKVKKNKLLYLPTWEGSDERWDYSSVAIIDKVIENITINTDLTMNVRLHPFTGRRIKSLNDKIRTTKKNYSSSDKVFFSGTEKPLIDVLSDYDYFICDISSVVTECLALGRPIFLYKTDCNSIKVAKSNISLESFCYTFSELNELNKKLKLVLGGNDYKIVKRAEAAEYFIGLEETRNSTFKKLVSEQVIFD